MGKPLLERRPQPPRRWRVERRWPLLVHGEVTDPAIDIFDREAVVALIERKKTTGDARPARVGETDGNSRPARSR